MATNITPAGPRRVRLAIAFLGLMLLLAFTIVFALMVGSVGPIGGSGALRMPMQAFIDIMTGRGENWPLYRDALVESRLPRIAMALLVGCALSGSGTAMQATLRNPMADPYIIGISSGAAVGAAMALFLPFGQAVNQYILPLLAFIGATGTVFGVYAIARGAGGRLRSDTLLLSGIAVGAFLSALTSFALYVSGKQFNSLYFWLLGGLTMVTWDVVWIALVPIATGVVLLTMFSRDLNAMSLGDEPAMHLGIDASTLRKIVLVLVALLAGLAVAFSGIIGFVGLMIPHMVRLIVGPDHRVLLPASTVAVGIFLVWADTVARTIAQPTEIPLGIITALCGAPFFLYLLWKSRR